MGKDVDFKQPYPIAISVLFGVSIIATMICIWTHHCCATRRGKKRGQWPKDSSGGSLPRDLEMGGTKGYSAGSSREEVWGRGTSVRAPEERTPSSRGKEASSTWGQGIPPAQGPETSPTRTSSAKNNISGYSAPLSGSWSKRGRSGTGSPVDVSDLTDVEEGKATDDGKGSRRGSRIGRLINPPPRGFVTNLGTVKSAGGRPARKLSKVRRDSYSEDDDR